MAVNFPGPFAIELKYVVDGFNHKFLYSCRVDGDPAPGTSVSLINLLTRDDSLVNIDLAVTAWVGLIDSLYHTSVSFGEYILWKYVPLSTSRTFVTAGDVGANGVSATVYTPAKQDTLTFRTAEGNLMKLVFLEGSGSGDDIVPLASAGGSTVPAIRDFVLSPANWILARDTSYPIAGLSWAETQNERVYKKRFRSN